MRREEGMGEGRGREGEVWILVFVGFVLEVSYFVSLLEFFGEFRVYFCSCFSINLVRFFIGRVLDS